MHSVKAVFVCSYIAPARSKISSQQFADFCTLFYPPQSRRPVDNSTFSCCPTQRSMRPFRCQARKPTGKAERKREADPTGGKARYPARMVRKRKRKKQESGVAAGQRTPCAGRGLTAKSQRRAGYRKQSGKPAPFGTSGSRTPESGKNGLRAKDFQHQAQWALVAIPAPIYFALTAA